MAAPTNITVIRIRRWAPRRFIVTNSFVAGCERAAAFSTASTHLRHRDLLSFAHANLISDRRIWCVIEAKYLSAPPSLSDGHPNFTPV
jgi:hypothetical protein